MKPAQLGQRFITLMLVLPLGLAAVDAAAGDTEKVDASATESAAALTPTAIDLKQKWTRHVIAAGSAVLRGSDGVSLTETSGRLTIVSGHEQGNKVSVSVRPENPADVKSPWPKVVLPADVSGPAGRIDGPRTLFSPTWTATALWMSSLALKPANGRWCCSRPRDPRICWMRAFGNAWTSAQA